MNKKKSAGLEKLILDGTISPNSHLQKQGKDIDSFINRTLGEIGSAQRNEFESELKMEIFQDLIRSARKRRNLSQEQLGKLVGVKRSQISKLEKGYKNASISILSKIFNALDAKIRISLEIDGQELKLYEDDH